MKIITTNQQGRLMTIIITPGGVIPAVVLLTIGVTVVAVVTCPESLEVRRGG